MGFVTKVGWTFASQLAAVACTLAATIAVTRVLGPDGQGQLALLLTVPWMVSIVLEAGLSTSGVAAVTTGRIDMRCLRETVTMIVLILVVVGIVAQSGPVVQVAEWILPSLGLLGVRVVLAASFLAAAISLLRGCQLAAGHIRGFNILWIGDRVVLAGGLLCLWMLGQLTVTSMTLLVGFSYAAATVLGAVLSRLPIGFSFRRSTRTAWLLAGTGWRVALGAGLQTLNLRLDLVILNVIAGAGAGAVGVYSVAGSLANLLWYLPNATGSVWLSRVGGLVQEHAARRTASIARIVTVMVVVACLGLVVVGRPVIVLLFGDAFAAAYPALLLLLPGAIALAGPKVINSYLVSTGHAGVATFAAGVAVVVTVVLDLLLIPRWGANGAAVASSCAYVLFAVVFAIGFHATSQIRYGDLVPRFSDVRRLLTMRRLSG